ncbi:M23 family metallopeptidase [Cyanobacterium stanieri LEGE 03274]|uniref:M23 family metallopeptidase n=1 Tax=Cyanobacterium stanieri LEGE 03274 TaxID=1828756 RepID=A0ABR9V734_9CHRO|nr:M23 family metallopeptidase [Cyanobacterium stanieri]MBE9223718.1 M23 family metallopeptidase [Cyanobacterium stanieri LEGE 03274]
MFKLTLPEGKMVKLALKKWRVFAVSLFLVTLSLVVFLHYSTVPVRSQTVATASANLWSRASFPVENFQQYTSPFGYRVHPITGRRQFHGGLDIAAPLGSYVRNWWAGEVVGLSDNTGCGTMMTIRSGAWNHTYCHMMGAIENTNQGRALVDRQGRIMIAQGQTIPTGARIGRVGMTGRTTGPHLHWEFRLNGERIDPAQVLRRMYAQRS